MSTAQDQRFRHLANDHDAVAALPLRDGTLALTARDKSGAIAAAELVEPTGQTIALAETVRRLGAIRQAALAEAEAATEHLIAHLAIASRENPDAVNLSDVHRDTGVARQTLYNRLKDVALAKSLPRPGRRKRPSSSNGTAPAAPATAKSSSAKSRAA